jgi:hypothetical protein
MDATRIDASPNTKRHDDNLINQMRDELVPAPTKSSGSIANPAERRSTRVARILCFWKKACGTASCMRVLPVV